MNAYMYLEVKFRYAWSSVIYIVKDTILNKDSPKLLQVVMMLVKTLLDKGNCLTIDNFYSSQQLAHLTQQTYKIMKLALMSRSLKHKEGDAVTFQR
jgi:hypothetical protein